MTRRSYSHEDIVVVTDGDHRGMVGVAHVTPGSDTIGVMLGSTYVQVDPQAARLLTAGDRVALADEDRIQADAA
jgi:hypothetical protein